MAQFYSPARRIVNRQIITITINDLDPFGQGVARYDGKAMFIEGVLPGEQAEVQVTEDKKQFSRARLKRLLTTSPERVVARCPYFGICGGCQQQHASITLQQRSKSGALQRMIARETGQEIAPEAVIDGPAYGYRRRARLGLRFLSREHKLIMGFRKASSHELVDIQACPVLAPELESLLPPLRICLTGLKAVRRLGHAELVLADNGPVLLLRHLDVLSDSDVVALRDFAAQQCLTIYLAADSEQLIKLCGETPYYQVDGLQLGFSPRDFIQVNDVVNQHMVAQVLAWLDVQPDERVLDLFCGMGNFTLPLARRAKQVIGVEGVASLVAQGRYNADINMLSNVEFFHHNLAEDVARQPWAQQGFDKILLDPARAGAAGVMTQIVNLAPQRVVYVSCNPATLARDSTVLLAAGYRMAHVRMLDMFPHTGHLESMALFTLVS